MYTFKELGQSTIWLTGSVRIFFRFLGHFFSTSFQCLTGPQAIGWTNFIKTLYLSGAHLLLPVVIISFLLGISTSLTVFSLLSKIHHSENALSITLNITVHTILPLLIGILLSIQSALNLITANIHHLHHSPSSVMCEFILPIIISVFVNGFILYLYALYTFLITIYSTYQFIISMDIRNAVWNLATMVPLHDFLYSLFKVGFFCCIITLVLGYYYYEISIREVSLRTAVSRIMTRSLFFIILFGAYFSIFHK